MGGQLFVGSLQTAEALTEEFEIRDETVIPVGTYYFSNVNFQYDSDKSKKLSATVGGVFGSFFDGTLKGAQLGLRWKPTIHLKFDLQYQHNVIDIPFTNGKFATNLFSGRINYAFTTTLFTKVFIQWNDADGEANLNFLFNYRYIPGADIYLVYNELWDVTSHLNTKDRTVIAKVTYLFDL